MRYHPTPIRMAAIRKLESSKCWWGCKEFGALVHCWWECKLVWPLWKTVWRFLEKLKMELPYDPVGHLLSKWRNKNRISKKYLHSYVHWDNIHNRQNRETTCVSINRWRCDIYLSIYECVCVCVCTGSSRSKSCLSVVGRVHECLAWNG